jgi:hypothetical protein
VNTNGLPFYQRHAWVLLFAMGLFLFLFGIGYIVIGLASVPNAELTLSTGRVSTRPLLLESHPDLVPVFQNAVTEWGIFEASFGALVMILAAVPFRRGERWAWFALWAVPLSFAGAIANAARVGASLGPLPIFLVVPLLGLALAAPLFFRSKPSAGT